MSHTVFFYSMYGLNFLAIFCEALGPMISRAANSWIRIAGH